MRIEWVGLRLACSNTQTTNHVPWCLQAAKSPGQSDFPVCVPIVALLNNTRKNAVSRVETLSHSPPGVSHRLPQAQVLSGLTHQSLLRPDGSILNTCSTAALVEMLAFLKRAFWPFPWDTGASESEEGCLGGSGFQGAAEVRKGV